MLEAPREVILDEVNVGARDENYRMRTVAEILEETVPDSAIQLADSAEPDIRNYRVDTSKMFDKVPAFQPRWRVKLGVEQLRDGCTANGLDEETFLSRLMRIAHIEQGQAAGTIESDLRPVST